MRCGFAVGRGNLFKWLRKGGVDAPYEQMARTERTITDEVPWQEAPMPRNIRACDADDNEIQCLTDRGLTRDDLDFWDVRFVTRRESPWPNLVGWHIFPYTEGGEIVYWQARNPDADCKFRKYDPPLKYGKSKWLYGVDTLEVGKPVYVSEGTLDVISTYIAMLTAGIEGGAVGVSGTTMSYPSPECPSPWGSQAGKLMAMEPSHIISLLDGDASIGDDAPSANMVQAFPQSSVSVIHLPRRTETTFHDPNSAWQFMPERFMKALTQRQATRIDFE